MVRARLHCRTSHRSHRNPASLNLEALEPRLLLDGLNAMVHASAPLAATEIIVDNLSPGFTKTGTWNESAAVDEYAASSVTATAIGAKATWRPTVAQAGTYQVWAWWSAKKSDGTSYDRDSAADYTIHYSGGTAVKTVDQDKSAGQWNLLGTFSFASGTGGYVDLVRDTANGTSTCADAVKLVQVTAPPASEVIVDNTGAGFSKTGTWSESAAVDEYAGSSVTASAIGATATWRPTLAAGTYDVYAWWSAKKSDGTFYDRDSQASYVVHYSGGTASRTVDQDKSSGQWVRLGTFAFAAGTSGYVDLVRDTANGTSTCADAVKFVAASTAKTWYVDDITDPLEDGSALHPFDSVQQGIDAAQTGDTVIVNPGTYRENITFRGRDITVRSTNPADPAVVAATVIGDRDYFLAKGRQNLSIIVDNTSPNFSRTGTWQEAGASGEFGGSSLTTTQIGAKAIWSFGGFAGDQWVEQPYEVWAWWGDLSASMPVSSISSQVEFNAGSGRWPWPLDVDQRLDAGHWNLIGTAHGGNTVELANTDGLSVDADAIRVVPLNYLQQELPNVVEFSGAETAACVLSGLTIQGGFYGIAGHGTHATLNNNVVTDNGVVLTEYADEVTSSWDGGGIFDCDGLIQSNTVTQNVSGGLSYCDGTIQSNLVSENVKESGDGRTSTSFGGLYHCNGMIRDNTIVANQWGGGVVDCDGTIQHNLITGNTALEAHPSGNLGGGGGLGGCDGLIQNNVISGNSAGHGAGVVSCAGTFINNIISDNSADYYGGGIDGCTGQFINNTITGNTAPDDNGSAIAETRAQFTNCIIDGGVNYDYNYIGSTFRYCDVVGSGGSARWNADFGTDGGGNIDAAPTFANAADPDGADNKWFTADDGLALWSGSKGIDAGSGSVAPATDILGNARRDDAGTANIGTGTPNYTDMGAYEFQGTSAGTEIIVDNLGAGFSKTGTWNESAAADEYAGSSLTASAIGAKATWRPTLPTAGSYEVWAWWSAKKSDGTTYDRDSTASYVIHYSGGSASRTVNQDVSSGQWVRLGTFTFAAGTGGYVDLTRDAADGASTCADAVKFVKVA